MELATATAAELLTEYARVTSDLCDAYRNRARSQVAKLQTEVQTWFNAPDDRLAARDKMAQQASLTFATDLFRDEGEIRSLEALRDFILWRLNNFVSVAHIHPVMPPISTLVAEPANGV